MISCVVFTYSNQIGNLIFHNHLNSTTELEALQDLLLQLYEIFKIQMNWERPTECCIETKKKFQEAKYCMICSRGLRKIDFYDFMSWIKDLIFKHPDDINMNLYEWKAINDIKILLSTPVQKILVINQPYKILSLVMSTIYDNTNCEVNVEDVVEYQEARKLYENHNSFEDYLKSLRVSEP